MSQRLPCGFFERPVLEVARDLLGCTFLSDGVGGRLVEVEAYREDDPASHAYRGRTARNAVMYGPPGRLYVYFTMGLHFCVNVVCGPEGQASAVLLRALEPTAGLDLMRVRRGFDDPRRLCSGPAKLTQALAITLADNGAPACVGDGRFTLLSRDGEEAAASDLSLGPSRAAATSHIVATPRIVSTPRIGVAAGAETPWRFVDADSAFLSRPLSRRTKPGLKRGEESRR